MIKTTVHLDERTALSVREIAKSTGRSQAEVVRDALRRHFEAAKRLKPQGIGQYRSGRSSISEEVEEVLQRVARERQSS